MISTDLDVAAAYFAGHAEDGGVYLNAARCRHLAGLLEAHARDARQFEQHEAPGTISAAAELAIEMAIERARRRARRNNGGDAA